MAEMAAAINSAFEQEGIKTKLSQSRLSQLENSSKGMTPELLEKYAGFFELSDWDRLEFYLTAYEALSEVTLNLEKIHPYLKPVLLKFLSAFMADRSIVGHIQHCEDKERGVYDGGAIQRVERRNNLKNSVIDWINDIYRS